MTLEQIGNAIGRTKQNVGHMIKGRQQISVDQLIAISKATKVPVPPELLGAPHPIFGVAQDVSQANKTLPIQRHEWEGLMTADLSQPFELEVKDDALSPEIYRGCVARFDPFPLRQPTAGRPVLVRDRAGQHYLRDYQMGPGGSWQAVARQRGYAQMDSQADALTIVAVLKGIDWP